MGTEKYEFKERLEIVRYLGLISVSVFMIMFRALLPLAEHFNIMVYSVVILICSAILGAATLVMYNVKGSVQADTNGVKIKLLLFGKLLSERDYEYDDIKNVSCTVEKHRTKLFKYYNIVFVFILADGKKLCFVKRLKLKYDIERKNPDDYCSAVGSEAMFHLYSFVMNCKEKE